MDQFNVNFFVLHKIMFENQVVIETYTFLDLLCIISIIRVADHFML